MSKLRYPFSGPKTTGILLSLFSLMLAFSANIIGQTLTPSSDTYCEGSLGVIITADDLQIGEDYELWAGVDPWNLFMVHDFQAAAAAYQLPGFWEDAMYELRSAGGAVFVTITITQVNIYQVNGGGTLCNGNNAAIGLSASQNGVNYELYRDAVLIETLPGIHWGGALSFTPVSLPGTYTITAVSPDCSVQMNGTAEVTEQAVSSFVFDPNNVCSGTPITFTSTVVGGTPPYTYVWDFGEGEITTDQPEYTYVFPAFGNIDQDFEVFHNIVDASTCASIESSEIVTVSQRPDASLDSPLWNGCNVDGLFELEINNISTTSATNFSYTIAWGDGSPVDVFDENFVNTTHIYNNPGSYDLFLSIEGQNGCEATNSYSVFYGTNPVGGIAIVGSITGCAPIDVDFELTGVDPNPPGTAYSIDFGDGQSLDFFHEELANYWDPVEGKYIVSHTYIESSCGQPNNRFMAELTITNPCPPTTVSSVGPVQVSRPAVPDFLRNEFPDDPIIVCVDTPISFINDTDEGCLVIDNNNNISQTNYYWEFYNDGTTQSTVSSPTFTYDTPGTYQVRLTAHTAEGVAGDCGSTFFLRDICVQEVPVPDFDMVHGPPSCVPYIVDFNNLTTHSACATPEYTWNIIPNNGFAFIDGTDANSLNPRIEFQQMGTYTITLRASTFSNGALCTQVISADQVLSITDQPEINLFENSFELCGFQDITFTNQTIEFADNGQNINDFEWVVIRPDASVDIFTDEYPTIDFNQYGFHNIQVGIENICGVAVPVIITVEVVPELSNIAIDALVDEVCVGESLGVIITGQEPQNGGGDYEYSWEIDEGSGWVVLPGETEQNLDYQEALTFNPTRFRRIVSARICEDIGMFEVTVSQNITDNFVVNDAIQHICSSAAPEILNGSVPNGGSGIYDYLWQQSTDNGANWVDASGVNDEINYGPPALNQDTRYRRTIFSGNCISISDEVLAMVYGPIVNNAIASPTSELCVGQVPAGLSGSTPSQAGNNGFAFQWQSSQDGIVFANINGSTSTNYAPGSLSETTYFRRLVTSDTPVPVGCNVSESNSVMVIAHENPEANVGPDFPIPYGTTTTLNGVAASGTPPYGYLWTGPVINPTNASTDTEQLTQNQLFTFTVTDDNNCTANDQITITVTGGALQVVIQADNEQICSGTSAMLTATASGGNDPFYSYSWSSVPDSGPFPDNNTITVSPTSTTNYIVIVEDGFNTVQESIQITVNNIPVINSSAASAVCSGEELNYGITSSIPASTYSWLVTNPQPANVSGASDGNGSSITQTLTNTGTDPVILIYTIIPTGPAPTFCVGDPFELAVTVRPQFTSTFQDITINMGTSTIIGGNITGGTGSFLYAWQPEAMIQGPSNVLNPQTVILSNTQAYSLNITDGANCSFGVNLDVITDGDALDVILDSDAINNELCFGESITLTATATGGGGNYSYNWNGIPGNAIQNDNTVIFTPQAQGNNVYSVVVGDGFTTTSESISISANPLPTISSLPSHNMCSGTPINYNPAANIANSSFNWTSVNNPNINGNSVNGSGNLMDILSNTTTSSQTVVYTITPTGPAPTLCTGTPSDVNVSVNPVASVTNTEVSQTVISGQSTTAVGFTSNVLGVTFSWTSTPSCPDHINYTANSGSGPIPEQIITIDPDGPNSCTIEYEVTPQINGCPGNTFLYSFTINSTPTVYNLSGEGIICAGESTQAILDGSEIGISYQMLRNNTPVQATQDGTGNPLTWDNINIAGIYEVMATNPVSGLSEMMNGQVEVILRDVPTIYQLSIQAPGSNCLPVNLRLNGSQLGVNYYLNRESFDGQLNEGVEIIAGTGSPLLFTTQNEPGFYSVTAVWDHGDAICSQIMNNVIQANPLPTEFTILPQGIICEDIDEICLTGSEPDVNYALWFNNAPLGAPVPGDANGGSICLGPLNEPGTYRIRATNTITGCDRFFQNTIEVEPLPIVYQMSPEFACAGTDIILEDCQAGIDYYLYLSPANARQTIEVAGPLQCVGGQINFGPQFDAGEYSIMAVNPATNCFTWMNGTTIIYPAPDVFAINPQGGACPPTTIYLDNFQTGVTYFLYRDGQQVGSDDGSDGSVVFAPQSAAGTYTVSAQYNHPNGISCTSDMSGSLQIFDVPAPRTLLPPNTACAPVDFYLTDSETGITYELWHENIGLIQSIVSLDAGEITFDPVENPGQYWARAINAQGCGIEMDGIRTVLEMPAIYTIAPQGIWCIDQPLEIMLGGSDPGVNYHLFISGSVTPVESLPGTGSALSFTAVSLPGTYYIEAATDDANACTSTMQGQVLISIHPTITSDATLTICNNGFTDYTITADVPDASFVWTATDNSNGAITGFADGIGNSINQQLINTGNQQHTISYMITPTGPAPTLCAGDSFELVVVVEPVAEVTNPENDQYILSGDFSSEVAFTSNITDQVVEFNWIANPSSPALTGFIANGSGDLPQMQIFIDPNVPSPPPTASVEYTVTPVVNGCDGVDFIYTIYVQLNPSVFNLSVVGADEICNDGISQALLELDGSDAGVTYRILLDNVIQPQYDQSGDASGAAIEWWVDQPGTYTAIAVHDITGVTENMAGSVVILGRPMPLSFTLATQQPNNNCLPLIPRLSNSQDGAIYELLLEDANGIISVVDTQNGTAPNEPLLFAAQSLPGIYTVRALIDYNNITCERMMAGSIVGNASPQEFPLSPEGELCEDEVTLTMLGSEINVNYSLRLNGSATGPAIAGTGNPINFGTLTAPGLYQIHAENMNSLCEVIFAESLTVYSKPATFAVFPGNTCPGTEIFMTDCEAGIDYYLYFEADTRSGTREFIEIAGPFNCGASGIDFGSYSDVGIYRVMAVNPTTNCFAWMDNPVTIWRAPLVFAMAPQGSGCPPVTFTMEDSEPDVTYFLLHDGSTVATTIAVGGSVSFPAQTEAGIYTISAQHTNGQNHTCYTTMTGQFEILPNPEIYALQPQGPELCPPTEFFLANSQAGVEYRLYSNQTGLLQQLTSSADGEVILFAAVNVPGEYWATAVLGNCETQMIGIRTVVPPPIAYNITPAQGQWCSNDEIEIGLSDSDIGFTYELHRFPFGANPISTIPGNGNPISYGLQTIAGNYQILAINDNSGCERWMNGTIELNNPPLPFNITADGVIPTAGWYCPPIDIGLQLSEIDISYTLYGPDGNITIAGTGAAISFGTFSTPGEYTATAYNPFTACSADMPGTINIYNGPETFNLTAVGEPSYCFGDDNAIEIVLNSSQSGVGYQLYRDNLTNPVMPVVAGTGGLISWSPISQFGEGDYFVQAYFIDDPDCSTLMNGLITVEQISLPTANLLGTNTICESFCTDLTFNVTADLPFAITYTANNVVQPTLNFDPADAQFMIEVCPTEMTTYEIISVEYTAHPFCAAIDITGSHTIFVDPLPIANTGPGGIICETQGFHFGSATVVNATSWIWEVHEGQGNFDNPNWLTPVFYPSPVSEITDMTIRLVAFGIAECTGTTDTAFAVIQVYPEPQVYAGANDSTCINTPYALNQATAEHFSELQWEVINGFGTIDMPNTLNPSYIPHASDAGLTVVLRLTAIGEGPCSFISASDLISIYIEGMPTANAGPALSTCVLNPVQVTQATASYYADILWTHDGNGEFTNPDQINPIYTPGPNDAGTTVTLTLTASGQGSCDNEEAVSQTSIQIDAMPEVFAGNDSFVCEIEQFHLAEATAENTTGIIWSIINGNGTISNPDELNTYYIAAPSDAGNTVRLRLRGFGEGNCGSYTDDSFIDIDVITSPVALFNVESPTCVNEQVLFEDASTTQVGIIEQWVWNFGDGSPDVVINFPDNPNRSHLYSIPGNYDVTLTVTNTNGCEADYTISIQLTPAPFAAFVIQGGLCADSPINFIDLSQPAGGGEITAWHWEFGDSNTSDLQNPSHSFENPGDYTVSLAVTNENGCISNIFEQSITIGDPIAVEIEDADLFACLGEPYQFNGISDEAVNWFWEFGDGNTSTVQNPQHSYAEAGLYFVTLTGTSADGCSAIDEVMVVVNPSPIAGFTAGQAGCTNEDVFFTDTSVTPNGLIVEWLWDMGDGTVYNITNPADRNVTHQYDFSNDYFVTLTITDAAGCSDSFSQTIVIQPGPTAFFSYDENCAGQAVVFTDLSITNGGSDITSWLWDFGDVQSGTNNSSALQNPAHTFVGEMPPDGYNVTLTVTNATGCSHTVVQQVIVNDSPFVDIIASQSAVCLTEAVLFTGVGDNVVSWLWNFGDGNTATVQNPIHTYLVTGTYNVSLTIVTAQGCVNTANTQIVVNDQPVAGFTTNSPVCFDSPVLFSNTSVSPNGNIQTWIWNFGDGTSETVIAPDNPNVEHAYTLAGTYNVTLTVIDNAGCEDDLTRQVIVEYGPLANFTYEGSCFGNPFLFTDLSSPNGGPDLFSWNWDFGDPLSGVNNQSNLPNPSHVFTEPGIYTVTLSVTNTIGCSNTIEMEVEVEALPDIDFTFEEEPFCPGEQIQFTSIGDNLTTWSWDFGDGGTAIIANPTYIYSEPGTYVVSLTATNTDGCQGTVSHTIVVEPGPNANFTSTSPSCEGEPIFFSNTSNSPTGFIEQWIWNFGDGSPEVVIDWPENPDVEYTYALLGSYNASLTVVNSNGCTDTEVKVVQVIPSPVAAFNFVGTCAESPVNFIDLSQENGGGAIVSWHWNFGDPASGVDNESFLQNPTHSFTAPGDYTVTLTVTNANGCESFAEAIVTISEAIQVEIQVDNQTACFGQPFQFNGISDVAIYWFWDFGDGNTSTMQNPLHTYTTVGTYTVVLTAEDENGCSNTDEVEITVYPQPEANFISTAPSCSNNEVEFTDTSISPNGLIVEWLWDFGDGNSSTEQNPVYAYEFPGSYEVTLLVTDIEGCTDETTQLVQISNEPLAQFIYEDDCASSPVLFTDISSTNGGPDLYSWFWEFGDPQSGVNNTSTLQNPSHLFVGPMPEEGYEVILIVTNTSGCTDADTVNVLVGQLPEIAIELSSDTLCAGEVVEFTGIGDDITSWFWNFGDGGVSTQQNPSYVYAQPGSYTVTLTAIHLNGCEGIATQQIGVGQQPIANFEHENNCFGEITQFTDLSLSPGAIVTEWLWDFGDGNTSTDQNPAHEFAAVDDFFVTLTVTNNYGCQQSISRWVSIYDSPQAAFNFIQVCEPNGQVYFFDQSQSGAQGSPIVEYEWHFHGDYYASELNPNFIFPVPDSCYVVTLTVTDAFGCSSVVEDTVCIWQPIQLEFTSTEVCIGEETFFEAFHFPEDDTIISYTWNFNDGTPDHETIDDTVSHTFEQAGTYFVELTALNQNGCTSTIYRQVVVNALPIPDFTYVAGICDEPTQFTDASQGNGAPIDSWFWDFGDGNTSTDRNPSHIYSTQEGTYEVSLTVTNLNGCENTIVKEIYKEPCLQASFILPFGNYCAQSEVCFEENSIMIATDGEIIGYDWNFGDGTTLSYTTQQNPICHTWTPGFDGFEGGEFDVSLTITGEVGGSLFTHTFTETITIRPKPEARFIPAPVCQGTLTKFEDNSIGHGEPIVGWNWNFGDLTSIDDTSSMQNPAYEYPTHGFYDVELIVRNEYGCSDTLLRETEVWQRPEADFSYDVNCASYQTLFFDESVEGGAEIIGWHWNFGMEGDTAIDQNTFYVYDEADAYEVQLVVNDENQCYDTILRTVYIYPIPRADFTIQDEYQGRQGQVYFRNESESANSYFWDFDDGNINDVDFNPVHQYTEDGTYEVMLVAYNEYNCPDTLVKEYTILFTGLYFPNTFVPQSTNPELNKFMGIGENLESYSVEVYTSWGQLVYSSTQLTLDGNPDPDDAWDGKFKGQDLPVGSYIWRASAVFRDGSIWKGADNGDGNLRTYGLINIIR